MTLQPRFTAADGLRYGLLGLPLAFVALPLYVTLPNYYAREFGVPLASLGALLLLVRLFDAVIDPWIGKLNDRLFARSAASVLGVGAVAALLLALGFALLFFPQTRQPAALLAWAGAALVITYAGYSALSVAHQSWGARIGGDESQRSRIVAWREGLGLAGVLLASVLAVAAGPVVSTAVFCVALLAGWLAWTRSVLPPPTVHKSMPFSLWWPLASAAFRRLLGVFLLNGIASAIPATLVLFYVQDRLQAPTAIQPAFLGSYFLCAALSMPIWLALVRRIGLARSWLCGMALSVGVFIWAAGLGTGDLAAFLAVCILSGIALGADLALPGAMLAGVIADEGAGGKGEGAYFGWWNFATKLNLALAAGLALPLLQLAGYSPGVRSDEALTALVLAYCVLPCILKVAAAATLYFAFIRSGSPP
ncbi:MAG: MFS transporter [Ramlibacter sp.]|nr:MFS transporter [Ramlibacter sp.]